jgi:phospholipid transport system substrate-binding protein
VLAITAPRTRLAKLKRIGLSVLAAVLSLLMVGDALAGPPTEQLRGAVDQVLSVLSDPELKKEAKILERRRAIRGIANQIFDFTEISRRSLALHWQARTAAEREEFTRLFGDLLEHSYISKIENYAGEKIQYVGETLDGDRAVVRTLIVTKQGMAIPLDYRMFPQSDRWRAYDVTLEGISLVANYRAQFNTIIQRSGYPDLVAKLRLKYDQRPEPREAVSRGAIGDGAGAPLLLPRQVR